MNAGWNYIWKLYGWKGLLSKRNRLFYFALITVLLALIALLINNDANLTFTLIDKIIDIGISILPTLLGFNLGAYALIIGFLANKNLISALVEKQEGETANALEKMSSIFAFNIIVQAFTLLVTFLIREIMVFIQTLQLNTQLVKVFYNITYISILNDITFFVSMLLIVYSIALVIQNAINIFDFNQLFTYFSLKKDDDNVD